jgi:stage V sporulation protein G
MEKLTNEVKISEFQFIPVKPQDGLIGFVSFVLDGKYYLSSVAVYTRLDGGSFRLVYPSKKLGERNINIFHPIDSDTGTKIEKFVNEKVKNIFDENYGNREQ